MSMGKYIRTLLQRRERDWIFFLWL